MKLNEMVLYCMSCNIHMAFLRYYKGSCVMLDIEIRKKKGPCTLKLLIGSNLCKNRGKEEMKAATDANGDEQR